MAQQPRFRPGGRRSRNWNLGEEIRSRLQPMHFSAPFGIIGGQNVGKKTLALRFSAMEADVLPRENSKTFFNSFHRRTLRPYDTLRPITLHLKAHICPPPEIAGHHLTTFDIEDRVDFCCFIFLFDISSRRTLLTAQGFMNQHASLTTNFLVGNKCDLRVSLPQSRAVPREEIDALARRRRMRYFEVSARTKENVQSLLEAIQGCVLREKYIMVL